MKLEIEIDEIEVVMEKIWDLHVMEKIWDLHDRLSDAIHSISRTHFLNSIKALKKSDKEEDRSGFVFVKGFRVDDNDSAIQEAKSLNAIRTALGNLEDQLELLQIVQTHQRAERDVAIARLEQSRIVLLMRLPEHHGKKHTVIEEALSFLGNVQDAARFMSPDNLYSQPVIPSGENFAAPEGRKFKGLINVLLSSFDFAKKTLKLDHMGGILGNAAMVAVS